MARSCVRHLPPYYHWRSAIFCSDRARVRLVDLAGRRLRVPDGALRPLLGPGVRVAARRGKRPSCIAGLRRRVDSADRLRRAAVRQLSVSIAGLPRIARRARRGLSREPRGEPLEPHAGQNPDGHGGSRVAVGSLLSPSRHASARPAQHAARTLRGRGVSTLGRFRWRRSEDCAVRRGAGCCPPPCRPARRRLEGRRPVGAPHGSTMSRSGAWGCPSRPRADRAGHRFAAVTPRPLVFTIVSVLIPDLRANLCTTFHTSRAPAPTPRNRPARCLRASSGPARSRLSRAAFTVGIGGPVGSGKTALLLALCRLLRDERSLAVVTNDIFTKEDGESPSAIRRWRPTASSPSRLEVARTPPSATMSARISMRSGN